MSVGVTQESPLGLSYVRGSYPRGLGYIVALGEQGLGSEEAELLFLLLLLPLGHAVEFLLGLPKDILEVGI